MNFNPRAPCGARLPLEKHRLLFCLFQSTRPVRGATGSCGAYNHGNTISIHAPRAGRDIRPFTLVTVVFYFNPRAPCGARQSAYGQPWMYLRYFNPRAPCGARPAQRRGQRRGGKISIHAPRAGRDSPTCSTRTAPPTISIHAPRAGRDLSPRCPRPQADNFNPRAPCGARPGVGCSPLMSSSFQSTRPVRGATIAGSISNSTWKFQSTRPVRGRDKDAVTSVILSFISIHAPRAGARPPGS